MKTFKQFSEEAYFAVENLVLESRGFGQYVKRRKKKRKKETEKELPVTTGRLSKRDLKISKLANRKSHWKGLT
jgi:hypothetical protein|tara:strand:+ start:685 stop:903 length:219 start_codon:yes stop_codon:yes gene_type:complete